LEETMKIASVNTNEINRKYINGLVEVYCESQPDPNLMYSFWSDWFTGIIEGDKLTVVAYEESKMVGAVRLWHSPFVNQWLVEGLEVHPNHRRKGVAFKMLEHGLATLKTKGIKSLHANILSGNTASIEVHKKAGFHLLEQGTCNSFGDFRTHINRYAIEL